jgi:hypothetical protein
MTLIANKKPWLEGMEFTVNVSNEDYSRHDLTRIYAVRITFTKVTFKQSNFSDCYFRNCRFVDCDFTGAFIRTSNLQGSQFENCSFRYTTWEKSRLDDDFMDNCLPNEENLARDLVRSLRVNFTETGNYEAVNRAAAIEVRLTGQHLYKAAYSREAYYRSKYKGWDRAKHGLQHAGWKVLEWLWGNGESVIQIGLSSLVAVTLVSLLYAWNANLGFGDAFLESLWHFWGKQYARALPSALALALAIVQFVALGLFMAILVKRLSRR